MAEDIPATPEGRLEWLKNPQNRDPIRRRGAGSVYYRGDLSDINSIEIVVSTRSNAVGAGLAHFGGLGEDEDLADSLLQTGIRNALREGQEEMEELLGTKPDLNAADFVFLYAARDDKFFINNGRGFAVDARLHACPLPPAVWEAMFPNGARISTRHPNHAGFEETEKAEALSLREALKRQDDYHYPHEYFALWVMAAKMMQADIAALATEISREMSPNRVDFTRLAKAMFISVQELESYLGPEYKNALQYHEDKFTSTNCIRRPPQP